MAVVRNMMIRAGADFSAITKQASKASQSMRGMQNSVTRSCNAMTKAANGLKKAFSAIGIAVSAAAIVNFAKDAAEAYDQQVESEVRLAQVMRNTMGARNEEIQSILDLTAAQQQLGVVGDEVQLAGAQELATYLSLSSSLETLIPVMNDMAVQQYGYNVTAEETASIATMLGKVMEGQTGALSRYGYYFDEAQENILKFGTEAERAATLAQVVEQSVGGMNAALAATPTGRMKQLSNTLGDIKEQFGQAVRTLGTVFLPLLNTVAKVLAAVATLANKVAQTIANIFGGQVAGKEWQFIPSGTTGAISDASDATSSLADSTDRATKAAKAAKQAFQQASFDTLDILKEQDEDTSSGSDYTPSSAGDMSPGGSDMVQEVATGTETASEGIGWLGDMLEKIKEKIEDFKAGLDFTKLKESWNTLKDAVKGFADAVGGVFESVWERVLKPFGLWTINEALPAALKVLAGLFETLGAVIDKWLRPAFEWLWDNFLEKIAHWAGDMFIKAMNEIAEQLHNIAQVINGEMSLKDFIAQLNPLEKILLAVAAAFVAIKTAMLAVKAVEFAKHIADWVSGLGKFTGVVGEVITSSGGLKGALEGCFGSVTTSIAGIGTAVGGVTMFVSAFVDAWQNGSSLITTAIEAIGLALAAVAAVLLGAPAAVAAAVAAVVFVIANAAADIHTHWDSIKEWGQQAATSVRDAFVDGWNDIKATASALWESTKQMFSDLKEAGIAVWNGIKTAATAAAEGIKTAFHAAVEKVSASVQTLKSHFESLKDVANKAVDGIKQAWNNIGEWFHTNVTNPIIEWGKQAWEKVKEAGSSAADKVKQTWSGVREDLVGLWNAVKTAGAGAWDTVKQKAVGAWTAVASAWGKAKTFFEDSIFQPLVSSAQSGVQKIIGVFEGAASRISGAVQKIKEVIKNATSIASQLPSGLSLKNLSISGLIDKLKGISIPGLAEGAVIPPNREFTAVLGDQHSGMNIETPERLLREIVRDESGNAAVMMMLEDILSAVRDGKNIYMDSYKVGSTVRRSLAMDARAKGYA